MFQILMNTGSNQSEPTNFPVASLVNSEIKPMATTTTTPQQNKKEDMKYALTVNENRLLMEKILNDISEVIDVLNDAQVSVHFDEAQVAAEEEFLACHFLRALNWERHGGLVTHLENQFTLGVNLYPKHITVAYNLAIKWKKDGANRQDGYKGPKPDKGISLLTVIKKGKGTGTEKKGGPHDVSKIKCFNCNQFVHYASDCKEPRSQPPETVNTTTTAPPSDISAVTGITGVVGGAVPAAQAAPTDRGSI